MWILLRSLSKKLCPSAPPPHAWTVCSVYLVTNVWAACGWQQMDPRGLVRMRKFESHRSHGRVGAKHESHVSRYVQVEFTVCKCTISETFYTQTFTPVVHMQTQLWALKQNSVESTFQGKVFH